ncbi:tetratricopeptide repeat protein [Candidatus Colwellia aromaticivorans]|uniref:tetratricopeptide repeat protein n=1 Tax=Candidatus Colwellia aromaticivorans TaxID=2267621 RepID=UPI000DF21996|nr:tetratricopeptide repeat protein [Candidatus Colwellia aromaticivorans]
MSVINQMLKDLEQRTPEQGQVAMPVVISHKPSTIKIVLISLAVLVSFNLLGFYIWNLQEQISSSELKIKEQVQSPVANVSRELPRQLDETLTPDRQTLDRQEPIPEKLSLPEAKAELAIELPQQPIVKEKVNLPEPVSKNIVAIRQQVQPVPIKPKPISPAQVNPIQVKTPTESKMSVSRRQLTSKELVAQKLVRAEKSIKINDITKAEQLFEEVLIIDPNYKQARKKLAALWFGRKSYQQATNLLSQGISLDRNDAELRQLKARIHLQQGQHKAAYDTLKVLPTLKQQEYQVMLANVSQQIEQYKSAIQAYKILIDMQAYSGRWHLGLAIVYDKNSQFSLAVTEYALALTKSDLSIASAEFAQQRMQALGE